MSNFNLEFILSMYSRELGDMSTQFRDSVIDAGRTAKSGNKTSCLVKTGVQALHILIGLGFLILALYEFILNPPYFDVVGYTRRQNDSLFVSFCQRFLVDAIELRHCLFTPRMQQEMPQE